MKIIYAYVTGQEPKYIDSYDQKVLVHFADNGEEFVYYANDYTHRCYINKINNPKALNLYSLNNLDRIENDAQFDRYEKIIHNLFNYQGLHLDAPLDG